MPFYKDTKNDVHFIDSAEFVELLPSGCVEIDESEASAINTAKVDHVSKKKTDRFTAVKNIVVTTSSGNSFDGNEDAQNRMARALVGMGDADSMLWVLANNSIVSVGKAELREALRLAGQVQAGLWVQPYL